LKKVLYIIGNQAQGNGGHFYSLNSISSKISENLDCSILVVGKTESEVLNNSNVNSYYLYYDGKKFFKVLKQLLVIVKENHFNVIHSFDDKAFTFSILISSYLRIPLIQTKCGGPSREFYPFCKNLILFSEENWNYLKKVKKFSKANLYQIPNRVLNFKDDSECIESIKKGKENHSIFIRISRIGSYYEKSLQQSVNLIKLLNKEGLPSYLFIIGYVQSQEVYNRLRAQSNGFVVFLTNRKFTYDAKKCINAADVVIGTGRSLMEGAIKGKILITPLNNLDIPVLVDKNNIQDLHYANFSGRTDLIVSSLDSNIKEIRSLLENGNKKSEYQTFIDKYCDSKFVLNRNAINKYHSIYEDLVYSNDFRIIDFIKNYVKTLRAFKPSMFHKLIDRLINRRVKIIK
jgi:hypothetical protein